MYYPLYFLLVASIAIMIHEGGHYLFARLFGVRVERASLFFNVYFTLLKYDPLTGRLDLFSRKVDAEIPDGDGQMKTVTFNRGWLSLPLHRPLVEPQVYDKATDEFVTASGVLHNYTEAHDNKDVDVPKWRRTQYCLGWLPCGGYVTLDRSNTPEGMLSKTNMQQFLINFGGILFNIITIVVCFAILIYANRNFLTGFGFDMVYSVAYLSIFLAAFNILPLPGLDGSGMLLSLLNYFLPAKARTILRHVNSLLGVIVFFIVASSWFRDEWAIERWFSDGVAMLFDFLVEACGM